MLAARVHFSLWLTKKDGSTMIQLVISGVSINGGTPNGWFINENPLKMHDLGNLGVPLFQETSICRVTPNVEP